VDTTVVSVRSGDRPSVVDLTGEVTAFCEDRGDGLVSVFVPHATAGVGTWQSIVLVDTNVDNPERSVRLSFLPG
jgi:thiamine phosphate synthase YjbQ (UPF0047 family)